MNIDLHHLIADKARIEYILDFLPYPFLISEFRETTYYNLYFNKKFREELGYNVADMPTIDAWFDLAYPDDTYRQEVIKLWNEKSLLARASGEDSALMKVIIRTKTNGYQWFEAKSTISGDFQMVAFVNIGETIIREKTLERLLENKNRTLSILAHDLRTPVANLQSLAQLMLTGLITEREFEEQLKKLNTRSTQLLDFIDTTLLWTKTNFESIKVKSQPVNLPEIVQSVKSLYEHNCAMKDLKVQIDIEHLSIESDPEILKILLRNLLTNAIKFTPDGRVVSISGRNMGKEYCLTVEDQGIGMSAAAVDTILRMDEYSSQPGTRQEKGIGIGLKLCLQLVKKINGTISINSAPQRGTRVQIHFTKK